MKKIYCLEILLFVLSPLYTQAQDEGIKLDIYEIESKVLEKSKQIKLEEHKLKAKESMINDAQNSLYPDLSINGSIDKVSNFLIYDNGLFKKASKHDVIHTLYSTNTNLYLNIYEGLKTKNSIKLRKLEAELQRERLTQQQAFVKLQAFHLFLDLYLQKEWEKLMITDIEDKEHQLKEIQDLHELGIVLQSDVLRSELELSKRKITLIEIQNEQKKINQQLNVLIGLNDEQKIKPVFDIETLPLNESFNDVLKTSISKSYEERLSSIEVAITEKNYDLIKANNTIKIGMGGSFQFSNPQIFLYPYNDSWYNLGTIGLKASYSFSELYKNKNKKRVAEIEIEESHEHHKKIQDEIRTKIYQDYLSLDEAVKYVSFYKLNKEYALENARILKDAYFNQTALITDLLDADVLVLKSVFELKQSKINVFKNYYKLQYSKGTL